MTLLDAFLPIFIAHLIGDFILQTEQMASFKGNDWRWLLRHATELGLITWLFCWGTVFWPVACAVFLGHIVFDWIKPRLPGRQLRWYILDQSAHIIVLLGCAQWIRTHLDLYDMPLTLKISQPYQAIIAAYLLAARPMTVGVGLFLKPWQEELLKNGGSNGVSDCPVTGLTRSGEWIGNLERFVILSCILAGQYLLIGTVIIMKAIMRFGELGRPDQRKRTDYVIIGTLASVGTAIAVGFLALLIPGVSSVLR